MMADQLFAHLPLGGEAEPRDGEVEAGLPEAVPHGRARGEQDGLAVARVGGEDKLALIREEDDEALRAILYSWPPKFDNERALGLGFSRDESFDDVVRDFKEWLEKRDA